MFHPLLDYQLIVRPLVSISNFNNSRTYALFLFPVNEQKIDGFKGENFSLASRCVFLFITAKTRKDERGESFCAQKIKYTFKFFAPAGGLEPPTHWLTASCSTN